MTSPERAMIPADWDDDLDLLVIVGQGGAGVAARFAALGLKRIIVFLPATQAKPEGQTPFQSVQNLQELTTTLELLPGKPPKRYLTAQSQASQFDDAYIQRIRGTVEAVLQRKAVNQQASDRLGPLWGMNGLRNLPAIARASTVSDLQGAFRGLPLLIVGAGPSLQKNLALVKHFRAKGIVLGINRVTSALHNAAALPDLVMALESQDVTYQLDDVPLDEIKAMILTVTVKPELFDYDCPRFVTYSSNLNAQAWLYEGIAEGVELASAGSVSCSAFSLGLYWGCDPIVLIGQDLAFTDGQYYAQATPDGAAQLEYSEADQRYRLKNYSDGYAKSEFMQGNTDGPQMQGTTVPGYYGSPVPTSTDFAHFRHWFENTATDHQGKTRMINATEGGAYIGGMEHIPLAQVLEELPDRNIDINGALDTAITEDTRQTRIENTRQRMRGMQKELRHAIEQAERCTKIAKQAKRNPRRVKTLDNAEKKLMLSLRALKMLALMDQAQIRDATLAGRAANTIQESLNASLRLFKVVIHEGRKLEAPLKEALTKL